MVGSSGAVNYALELSVGGNVGETHSACSALPNSINFALTVPMRGYYQIYNLLSKKLNARSMTQLR